MDLLGVELTCAVLDIFQPEKTKKFKKTSPGPPDFKLIVFNATEPLISPALLPSLAEKSTPILICLWAKGTPFFLSFAEAERPDVPGNLKHCRGLTN